MTNRIFKFSPLSENISSLRYLSVGVAVGLLLHVFSSMVFRYELVWNGILPVALAVVGLVLFGASFYFGTFLKRPLAILLIYFYVVAAYFGLHAFLNDFKADHTLLFMFVLAVLTIPFFSVMQLACYLSFINVYLCALLALSPQPVLNPYVLVVIFIFITTVLYLSGASKYRFRQTVVGVVNFLKNVFEATNEVIVILDKDGNIIDANALFRKLLNQKTGRLMGTSFNQFIDTSEADFSFQKIAEALQDKSMERFECRMIDNHGRTFLTIVVCSQIHFENSDYYVMRISDVDAIRNSEQKILQLQNTLSGIFNSSFTYIVALRSVRDIQGNITDFQCYLSNQAAANFFGTDAEHLNGKMLSSLKGFSDSMLLTQIKQTVHTGMALISEIDFLNERNEPVWLNIYAEKLEDGIVLNFIDNTQRKLERLELEKLSLVASKTSNVVVITDKDGYTEWVNDGFYHATGYTLEEVKGKKPGKFLQGKDTDANTVARISQALKQEKAIREEILNYHKNGTSYWIDMSITPVKDTTGSVRYFIAIESDISERKQIQHELQLAKESAEAASNAKADFLATMSHEIRTPMNAVIGMTSLLMETNLDEEQRDYVETVRFSGENLLSIINDILDFSKIESGKMELEETEFNLTSCIEDVFDLLSTKAMNKSLEMLYEIHEDMPVNVLGDITRLRQVLVNLINNAVKFTPSGEIFLSVKPQAISNDNITIEFSVKDTGIGIAHDKIGLLFQSFAQADSSTTRKYGGTGLGLAICKKLVELMGGNITASSEEGKGSEFTFTVEMKISSNQSSTVQLSNGVKLINKTVLIADDNATNIKLLETQLAKWKIKTVAFSSPLETLEYLKQQPQVDLCIFDMQMPDMDGAQLSIETRKLFTKEQLPIILLTSLGNRPAADKGNAYDVFVNKPVRKAELWASLNKAYALKEVKKETAPQASSASTNEVQYHKLKILVAEDNDVNQKVMLRMLNKLGYKADIAADGFEVMKALELRTYDLIFMDVQMPDMDGIDASLAINAKYGTARPKIIAMTANALQGDREKCLDAGMDDYVAKPVTMQRVDEAIHKWFPEVAS